MDRSACLDCRNCRRYSLFQIVMFFRRKVLAVSLVWSVITWFGTRCVHGCPKARVNLYSSVSFWAHGLSVICPLHMTASNSDWHRWMYGSLWNGFLICPCQASFRSVTSEMEIIVLSVVLNLQLFVVSKISAEFRLWVSWIALHFNSPAGSVSRRLQYQSNVECPGIRRAWK
jgi:hypothetical protein